MSEEASQAQDKPAGRKDDSGDHNEREYDQGLLHCILGKEKAGSCKSKFWSSSVSFFISTSSNV